MNECRFEDRLTQRARVLTRTCGRIVAHSSEELPAAFAQIEKARRAGRWVALLLEYELGEWLEPALAKSSNTQNTQPRLTALMFEQMHEERPWSMDVGCTSDTPASIMSVTPGLPKERYLARIEQIQEWIPQGEVYQVNATRRNCIAKLPLAIQWRMQPISKTWVERSFLFHLSFFYNAQATL